MFFGEDWTDIIVEYYMDRKDGIKEIQKAIQKLKEVLNELGEEPYIICDDIKNCIKVLEICMNIIENYNVSLEDLQIKAKEKGITLVETPEVIKLCFKRKPSSIKYIDVNDLFWKNNILKITNNQSSIYWIDKLLDDIEWKQ